MLTANLPKNREIIVPRTLERIGAPLILVLFCIANLAIVYLGYKEYNLTHFFTFYLFLVVGNLLYHGRARIFFNLSYLFYVCLSVFWFYYFFALNGDHFQGGGDDHLFYTIAKTRILNEQLPMEYVISASYKGYIETVVLYYRFMNFMGIQDIGHYHFVLITCFVGAALAPTLYNIARRHYPQHIAVKSAFVLCFFPYNALFSSYVLRDIWVAVLILLTIRLLVSALNRFITTIVNICVAMYNTLGFRAPTGLVGLIVIGFYAFLGKKDYNRKLFLSVIGFFISMIFINIIGSVLFNKDVSELMEYYRQLSLDSAASGSIGSIIVGSNNPIIRALIIPISVYNPIPPFVTPRLDYYFRDSVAFIWYYMIPVAMYGIFADKKNRKLAYTFFFSGFLILAVIFIIFGSFRHKLLLVPIVILYYFVGNSLKSKTLTYIKVLHTGLLVLAFGGYFLLKII